jgi:hypothetical protein
MEEFDIIRVRKLISIASGKFMRLQKQIYMCTEKDFPMKNSTQGLCSKSMVGINSLMRDKIHISVFPTDCNCSICGCMLNLQGPSANLCPKCYFSWVETFTIFAKFEFRRVRRKKTSNEIGSAHTAAKLQLNIQSLN